MPGAQRISPRNCSSPDHLPCHNRLFVNRNQMGMKTGAAETFRAFLIELVVYAALVITYFFVVLHLLGGWLKELAVHHHYVYALVAILLIIGQAVFLESLTTFLMRLIR